MNKRQKICFAIIASLVAVTLIVIGSIFIVKAIKRNSGETTVYFENKTALAGDTVKIPICITKNHGVGFWGAQIVLNYDAEALTFESCANGDVFDECEVNPETGKVNIILNQTEIENVKQDGTLATLNFKIKTSAKKGDYGIEFDSLTCFSRDSGELFDPVLKNGAITVK